MIGVEEITLQWERWAAMQPVSRKLLESARFSASTGMDFVFDTLALRLEREVLMHRMEDAVQVYNVPASWWQHFKRDALNRLPGVRLKVRNETKTITWERGLRFPYAEYPPQLGQPVHFVRCSAS